MKTSLVHLLLCLLRQIQITIFSTFGKQSSEYLFLSFHFILNYRFWYLDFQRRISRRKDETETLTNFRFSARENSYTVALVFFFLFLTSVKSYHHHVKLKSRRKWGFVCNPFFLFLCSLFFVLHFRKISLVTLEKHLKQLGKRNHIHAISFSVFFDTVFENCSWFFIWKLFK